MISSQATGPGSISVELFEALGDHEIDEIATLFNKIYDTGQIPPDICKSIFKAQPKKQMATKC